MSEPTPHTWFVFDLGNVLIRLAYERVVAAICAQASLGRDDLVELLERAGGYRDLERGIVTFEEFHRFLCDSAGFQGNVLTLRRIWTDFFAGPVEGIEDVLERVRARHRVAFLSNSNEVHAEVIPKLFAFLFERGDVFIFSHEQKTAKPDLLIYQKMLQLLGVKAEEIVYVDDLQENVIAARELGISAFRFRGSADLLRSLEEHGILPSHDLPTASPA
ncbi:MAG TPA: HAD family phosphatase [Thermoanaerobaculia bacterium]|nr:HAD family phosphatase [Thermoanaerobaculia bacterium]